MGYSGGGAGGIAGADVFEIQTESDFPTPSGGISTLLSGKYILKDEVTLSAITEFQCTPNAVIEWQSEDKENHTLNSPTTSTLFNLSNGSRFKIEHASFKLTGNNTSFITLTGAHFNSKINDFRITFTGTGTTIGNVSNIFAGTTEFVDGFIGGFKDGLGIDNTGGTQVLGVLFVSDGTSTGAILNALNVNALAVNFNSNVFIGGSSQSAYFIDPTTPVVSQIHDTVFAGVGSFFKAGATGTFTAVADASVPAEAITSVTDSSGVARFNFSNPPTLFVNQEVVISGFTTNTAYNGTYIITATGVDYFEVSSIDYGSNETGSFLSNSVTLTDTGTSLIDGNKVLLDTSLSVAYDTGTYVYNKQTNSVQVNATWSATATGTWDTGSLTEKNKFINALGNGSQADSSSNASLFSTANVGTTSCTGSGTWNPMNLGTASEGQSISDFKLINTVTGEIEYVGLNPYEGGLAVAISAFKSAASIVDHKFRVFKTVGSGAFDVIAPTRGLSTALASISLVTSIQLDPNDRFRVEIASQGAATTVTIQDISLTTG